MFSHAGAYDEFIGRYSTLLAPEMADFARVARGQRVLDVGCGPGALTTELVRRVGPDAVTAIDPSEPFVLAARERNPRVDVRVATAESLPFAAASFDAVLAQLVVHFMADPVAGIREMKRVTRAGGVVAACVWDAGEGPLRPFWNAARAFDPSVEDEGRRPGEREGHLAELFAEAGLRQITSASLHVSLPLGSFEAWWQPFELGVGRAGAFLAGLDPERRATLRERARSFVPPGAFTHRVAAWAARGVA